MVAKPKLDVAPSLEVGNIISTTFSDGMLALGQFKDYVVIKGYIAGPSGNGHLFFEKRIYPWVLKKLGYPTVEALYKGLHAQGSIVNAAQLLGISREDEIRKITMIEQPTSRNFEILLRDGKINVEEYPDGTYRYIIYNELGKEMGEGSLVQENVSIYNIKAWKIHRGDYMRASEEVANGIPDRDLLEKNEEVVIFKDIMAVLSYTQGISVDHAMEFLDAERIVVEM